MMKLEWLLVGAVFAACAGADDPTRAELANAPTPENAAGVVHGPYVSYPAPGVAEVQWETEYESPTVLRYWRPDKTEVRVANDTPTRHHRIRTEPIERNTTYLYAIETARDGVVSKSEHYEFDTTFNYAPKVIDGNPSLPFIKHDALRSLVESRGDKGYAIVFGDDGAASMAIAQHTCMTVLGYNEDAAAVQQARQAIAKAGAYGPRVSMRHVMGYANTQLTPHFANLVVCRGDAANVAPEVRNEIDRVLHPYGLVLFIDDDGKVASDPIHGTPIAGAGRWTHQYGDAANTSNSRDSLGGAGGTDDMMVQWLGRPGGNFGIDRNPRMPAPLSVNGRLFHQGLNKMVAMDMYNGAILWLHEIPGLRRVNLPRDASNWCADGDHVYCAIEERLWVFDAARGTVLATYPLPDQDEAQPRDWGYVAREGDLLFGSSTLQGSSYLRFFGKDEWYDKTEGAGTYKVCSETLFAMDPTTGEVKWRYSNAPIINTSITIADGKIMFVEARHPALEKRANSRIEAAELWLDQVLVTLDAETGKPVFEKPIDVEDGIVVFFAVYRDGWYVLESSLNGNYHLAGFDTVSWEHEWRASHGWMGDNHSGHMMHPAIVGNTVFLEPMGYNIATGEPVTDKVGRREGCATYAATEHALIYRGAQRRVAMWDIHTEEVTTWPNLRPSCWLSVIPAGGMILAPEGGAGCSCGGWIETSLGFIPKGG